MAEQEEEVEGRRTLDPLLSSSHGGGPAVEGHGDRLRERLDLGGEQGPMAAVGRGR